MNILKEIIKEFFIAFSICVIFLIIRTTLIGNANSISTNTLFIVLMFCLTLATIERLCFSNIIIKNISYLNRVLVFSTILTIMAIIIAIKLNWFNISIIGIIIRFIITYLIGGTSIILIDKYLTKEGEEYTKAINEYKSKNI
jgi:hypothetical protein